MWSMLLLPHSIVYAYKTHSREFYQITVYHFTAADQEKVFDHFLQQALFTSLHRLKVANVGVFKPISNDTGSVRQVYVLVPMKSFDMVTKIPGGFQKDKSYQDAVAE